MSADKPPARASSGTDDPGIEDYRRVLAERDALRMERDALRTEVEAPKAERRHLLRRALVGLLVALSCLGIVLSTLVVWTHRTVLNTDVFVSTVGPVFENPAVTNQVANRSTNQLFQQLKLENRLKDALPPKADFIAGPATNGAKSFVSSQLSKILASPQFQQLWLQILTRTHSQVVAVLKGQNTEVLTTSGGAVVLNTVPLINQALQQISQTTSSIVGKPVQLPTVTSAELPQSAVNKVSDALGIQLPTNFGQITLFKSDQLSTVQRGVKAFDGLTILLPLLTVALIALALWLSVSRRRTLVELLAVAALLIIVVRRLTDHLQGSLAAKANNPDVANQVLGQLLHGLFVLTAWILGIALLALAITLVTGPYRWAVRLRSWLGAFGRWVSQAWEKPPRQAAGRWVGAHGDLLRLSGAVLAGILLLVVSISWASFLVIGLALVGYELLINYVSSDRRQLGSGRGSSTETSGPGDAAATR